MPIWTFALMEIGFNGGDYCICTPVLSCLAKVELVLGQILVYVQHYERTQVVYGDATAVHQI